MWVLCLIHSLSCISMTTTTSKRWINIHRNLLIHVTRVSLRSSPSLSVSQASNICMWIREYFVYFFECLWNNFFFLNCLHIYFFIHFDVKRKNFIFFYTGVSSSLFIRKMLQVEFLMKIYYIKMCVFKVMGKFFRF